VVARLIEWSLRNRGLVLLASLLIVLGGIEAMRQMPLDAIPDLSDTQVIVKADYPGQSPQTVEDQVTYPLASALLSVPRSQAVRGFSMFGESYLYVIFEDGTDPYWARSRVLEYLNQAAPRLPAGIVPTLGPDASGVGWVFEYALVDRHHRHDIDELRALQDFFLKYELQSLPGVAEVASVGGRVRQFQIEADPNRLASYGLNLEQVAQAVRDGNRSGGGSVLEMAGAEYMVRTRGYLGALEDFRQIPLGVDEQGTPLLLRQVADVHLGPAPRRGVAELDGDGEVVGGIVVMRHDHNALQTVAKVKQRLKELRAGLPEGVELVVTYDRSQLIGRAIGNLRDKLVEESLVVALVCLLFLLHLRSSLVVVLTLPVGILVAFIVMRWQGIGANIMSLGGIAIAIGAMVDAAIVMIENMHKHLEREGPAADRWRIARSSAVEVGPALFFSLLIITVSFFPVFSLIGQEGKLFTPLACTKTYAMAASAALSVTLAPVLMGYLVRGRIRAEHDNPLNRVLQRLYQPVLLASLNHPRSVAALALLMLASLVWPLSRFGSEFMPPLYEGDLLYMPTTLPGVSVDEAARILQITDRLISQHPEVERVFGKAGRADSATDPAPLSMLETTILLKPRSQWPTGQTIDGLIRDLDRSLRLPGLSNSWGYPIRTRIDMQSTGIRSAVGLKVTGPDLQGISALTARLETVLRDVDGTRAVFGDRLDGGRYIDVDIDRTRAAQYGVSATEIERLVATAIGGENIGTVIDGRQRFAINLRYPRAQRDSLEAVQASRVTTRSGAQIPLSRLANIAISDGPAEIKSENGRLTGYVYIDLEGHDLGGYVERARRAVTAQLQLPPGYAVEWSGQYESMLHARERLLWIVPLTVLLVLLLLYLHFREPVKVLLVAICLPFSLVGGFWLTWVLGYQLSVAVAVGFIALAGVAIEFGVVMLLYIDNAVVELRRSHADLDAAALRGAVLHGALLRLRPKTMTVTVIVAGLLPVMFSDGAGSDVMKRIAAPLVGGMLTAPLLSLLLMPTLYLAWQRWRAGIGPD
jgi:Cu(I)/Ag(I) efflux system membrane protein CusA/SilA